MAAGLELDDDDLGLTSDEDSVPSSPISGDLPSFFDSTIDVSALHDNAIHH